MKSKFRLAILSYSLRFGIAVSFLISGGLMWSPPVLAVEDCNVIPIMMDDIIIFIPPSPDCLATNPDALTSTVPLSISLVSPYQGETIDNNSFLVTPRAIVVTEYADVQVWFTACAPLSSLPASGGDGRGCSECTSVITSNGEASCELSGYQALGYIAGNSYRLLASYETYPVVMRANAFSYGHAAATDRVDTIFVNPSYDPTASTGSASGGGTTGGDTSGGDTSGGDTSGGDTSGGDTSGGGTTSGGTTGSGTVGGITTPACGDGFCNGSETNSSCRQDCTGTVTATPHWLKYVNSWSSSGSKVKLECVAGWRYWKLSERVVGEPSADCNKQLANQDDNTARTVCSYGCSDASFHWHRRLEILPYWRPSFSEVGQHWWYNIPSGFHSYFDYKTLSINTGEMTCTDGCTSGSPYMYQEVPRRIIAGEITEDGWGLVPMSDGRASNGKIEFLALVPHDANPSYIPKAVVLGETPSSIGLVTIDEITINGNRPSVFGGQGIGPVVGEPLLKENSQINDTPRVTQVCNDATRTCSVYVTGTLTSGSKSQDYADNKTSIQFANNVSGKMTRTQERIKGYVENKHANGYKIKIYGHSLGAAEVVGLRKAGVFDVGDQVTAIATPAIIENAAMSPTHPNGNGSIISSYCDVEDLVCGGSSRSIDRINAHIPVVITNHCAVFNYCSAHDRTKYMARNPIPRF